MIDGTCDKLKFKRLCHLPWGSVGPEAKLMTTGLLERMWELTRTEAPRGDLGAHVCDEEFAEAVLWCGEPSVLIDALVAERWLDADDEYRLVVHNWPDRCPGYIKKRLRRKGLDFVRHTGTARETEDAARPPEPIEQPPPGHHIIPNGGRNAENGAPTDTRPDPTQPNPTDIDQSEGKASQSSGSDIGGEDLIDPKVCAQQFMGLAGLTISISEARCWLSAFEAIAAAPSPNDLKEWAYDLAQQVKKGVGIRHPARWLVAKVREKLKAEGIVWGNTKAQIREGGA